MNSQLPSDMIIGHTVFNPSESSSFKPINGASFNTSYGDSSFVYGNVATDTVEIGGAVVENQAFGLPTQISESFIHDTSSNGILGLASSKLNTIKPQKQKTFLENVADSLKEPVVTALLKNDQAGEYEFGTIDHSKYKDNLYNVSVDSSSGFWQFKSTHFAIGDENADFQNIKTPTTIADTGTSLMLVSPEVVDSYYAQVEGAVLSKGAGGVVFPCDAQLPNLSIAFGEEGVATIPGPIMSFAHAGTNRTTGKPCT